MNIFDLSLIVLSMSDFQVKVTSVQTWSCSNRWYSSRSRVNAVTPHLHVEGASKYKCKVVISQKYFKCKYRKYIGVMESLKCTQDSGFEKYVGRSQDLMVMAVNR